VKHAIDQSQTCDSPNPDILAPDITRKKKIYCFLDLDCPHVTLLKVDRSSRDLDCHAYIGLARASKTFSL